MVFRIGRLGPVLAFGWLLMLATGAAAAARPAILLVVPGNSSEAADTCKQIAAKVKERFPDHDIRLVSSAVIASETPKETSPSEFPDLALTLAELKAAGVTQAALQSLDVFPKETWEAVLKISQETKGLKIALGKPLLSSLPDRKRLLDALGKDFPADFQHHAVLLVSPGSTSPAATREALSLYTLMLSKLKGRNVFFGVLEGQPPLKNALGALKRSSAARVTIVPLMLVADDQAIREITGDKDSIKSDLLAARPFEIQAVARGLVANDTVIQIYLDHLAAALDTFAEKKKEKKPKKGKK